MTLSTTNSRILHFKTRFDLNYRNPDEMPCNVDVFTHPLRFLFTDCVSGGSESGHLGASALFIDDHRSKFDVRVLQTDRSMRTSALGDSGRITVSL